MLGPSSMNHHSSAAQPLAADGELAAVRGRVANMPGLSKDNLSADFARCYKAAQAVFKTRRCSRQEAWTYAFRTLTPNRGHSRMPALGHVLQRYLGWGISARGVEQVVAHMRRRLEHRGSASESAEETWLVLSEARPDDSHESDWIISRAQEFWCESCTEVARKGSRNALPGLARSSSSGMSEPTMANFLRRRQAAASAAAVADLASAGDVARVPAAAREIDHQTQRLAQRRAEAIGLGQLDATEVSAEELEAACTSNRRQQKLDMETERKRRRLSAIASPSPPPPPPPPPPPTPPPPPPPTSTRSSTAWRATSPTRICASLCPRTSGAVRGVCRTWRRPMWWLHRP